MPFESVGFLYLAAVDPGYVIAALFLAGLGIIFTLQIRHYRRMERLGAEIFRLQDLREHMIAIKQGLKEVDIESAMRRLDEIAGSMARLEQRVEDLPAREVKVAAPSSEKQEGDLLDAVVRRLEGEGFHRVSFLIDRSDVPSDPEGEFHVPLEAYRDGVAYKGHVTIRGGRILEEHIKPSYEAFP